MSEVMNVLWTEKYRPHTVEHLITTKEIKQLVTGLIEKKAVQNYLFVGPPGLGKTTMAKLILDVLGYEYIVINASLEGNIDTLRNRIQQFASTISFGGGRKYVILDEADYLNATSTQPALRNFMETFAGNCGFIATANYENRIIEPLRLRFETVRFNVPKNQLPRLGLDFTKRLQQILTAENITFDEDVLARFVMKRMPNWRAVINGVQSYAQRAGTVDAVFKPMFVTKDYSAVRKWVAQTINNDAGAIYSALAENLVDKVDEKSVMELMVILGKYQYQAAFVADQQINLSACLAEIMVTCLAK
jgi:DNA polymerase III delta prime subunit